MNLVQKGKKLLGDLKSYWKVPPKGKYMPFREVFSLSFGGLGIKFIYYCVNNMMLSVGNTLIGNTIGIDPKPLYYIYILGVLSSFPLTVLRAYIIDNTRSMKGKYRPYILTMAIPTAILGIGFVWMPYEKMTLITKCIVVLAFNVGFQFFFSFMNDSYDSILNVLSPNTIERSDVYAVKSVIENFSPSIANIFLPIVAKLITGDNTLYDLRIYRVLYPFMLFIGVIIAIPVYTNTREKIVQAKTHVIQIRFTDALRSVIRNKYFWIISLAGWLGFLESSFNNILGWMYSYQGACSAAAYSVVLAVSGNASFWPNLISPYLIRRYGKRNILVFTNLMSIGFITCMLPVVRMTGSPNMIWFMLGIQFVNTFVTSMGHFLNPSIQADIRDYQQYVTGERIDGMFAAVGLIGNAITLATSGVLPVIYERAGLNKTVALSLGYDGSNVYNVLYDKHYFSQICSVLIIASVVGAAMNVIPFFWYDLSEAKQKAMVAVLKIRAMFEDYGNGSLKEESLIEAIDIIREARSLEGAERKPVTKEKIKLAKKNGTKEDVSKAKKELKEAREFNEKLEISKLVLEEFYRFDSEEGRAEIKRAEAIVALGINDFAKADVLSLKEAKALPKSNATQKKYRSDAIASARSFKTAEKTAKKYYPNGVEKFDVTVFDKLFAASDENEAEITETAFFIKKCKESKTKEGLQEAKARYASLKQTKREIAAEIKKAASQNAIYTRAVKPYADAEKLLKYKENFTHYDDIYNMYVAAKEASVQQ